MIKTLETSPARDGFWMPGEFEPHAKCWMLWPYRPDNWRDNAKPAQASFAEVARAISRFEPVWMGVPRDQMDVAGRLLGPAVHLVEMESDDAWMRDVGPTFVTGRAGALRGVDWEFNAWGGALGGLYESFDRDRQVARAVLAHEGADRYAPGFILEGGSIHVDGQGTLITTEECLLNPNRNPELSRKEIEDRLKDCLSVDKVIWLNLGVYKDETDGHVDNLCCFARPGVVALSWTDDRNDPQYPISRDAWERLSMARDARGRAFEIHKIHQPGPLYITEAESCGVESCGHVARKAGDRLAGSYVNFYIANGGIVMPVFDDPRDRPAMDAVKALFPDREVVGVNAREILLGGGDIHCITQQQPG